MTGLSCARQAVAKHHSTPEAPLTENVSNQTFACEFTHMYALGCYHDLWLCRSIRILFYCSGKPRPKCSYSNSKSPP